ncbi:type II secretion system F family protein [Janthinobacterium sp. 17J80-10]|nr:type II secretion system F family protein [Janthinobacterium sp. 17J80-10]
MLNFTSGNSFLIISVLVFVAAVLLVEGLYLLWKAHRGPEAKKLENRLQALSASFDTTAKTQLLKRQMISDVPLLERLFLNLPQVNELQRLLHQAGLSWTVSRLVLTCAALGAGLLGSAVLLHQPTLASLIAGAAGAGVPVLLAINKRRHRLGKIEQQLPDAIDLLNRALRSGHAFSSGLKMIGEEMPEPIASEFRIVHDEVNFGVSLQQALTNLSQRIPLTDLRYFVVSVLIQRDSGGNLTEVLGNLSHLIRERLKLAAKVKVLSSEGRLSAWILVIMPFALGAIMNIVNPGFMAPLWTDPIGIAIVKYMLTLMFFGVLIMRKIIKIRY